MKGSVDGISANLNDVHVRCLSQYLVIPPSQHSLCLKELVCVPTTTFHCSISRTSYQNAIVCSYELAHFPHPSERRRVDWDVLLPPQSPNSLFLTFSILLSCPLTTSSAFLLLGIVSWLHNSEHTLFYQILCWSIPSHAILVLAWPSFSHVAAKFIFPSRNFCFPSNQLHRRVTPACFGRLHILVVLLLPKWIRLTPLVPLA